MSDTARPTTMAWRFFAPAPTRYAAVIVLPCPGPRACTAPNPTASSSEPSRISGVNRQSTSFANDPPLEMGAPETVDLAPEL